MTRWLVGAVVGSLGLASAALGQTIDVVDDAMLPRFEVAAIKPGDPHASGARVGFPPGRFVQENMNLINAFILAFGVRPYQLGTLPDLRGGPSGPITLAVILHGARPQDVGWCSAKRHTDADFRATAHDGVRRGGVRAEGTSA